MPVGCFLSGGVDSSLIVALASEQYRDLKTFSVGYEESDFDELKFDVILANPPFAGEMKDRKMLVHYELAKPAENVSMFVQYNPDSKYYILHFTPDIRTPSVPHKTVLISGVFLYPMFLYPECTVY